MNTDWSKIRDEYVNGVIGLRSLARCWGVNQNTLLTRAQKEHWTAQRAALRCLDSPGKPKPPGTDTETLIQIAAEKMLKMLIQGIDQLEPNEMVRNVKTMRTMTGALMDLKCILNVRSPLDVQEQVARISRMERDPSANPENKPCGIVLMPTVEPIQPPEECAT